MQYSCLDKLRVLTFMSAEHDVRVKTLLPKEANRTNSQPSSQGRCQSHWCCRAVFKSVYVCSGRNTAPTHSCNYSQASVHLWDKHLWWVTLAYNRCPHLCLNGHEQFAIEMFCQWSSVSTISRTTLWRRYDKEILSILCRKVSGKTKHFARYVPSVWLERHSFLKSYWLSMSVLTIPTLMNFGFMAIVAYHFE